MPAVPQAQPGAFHAWQGAEAPHHRFAHGSAVIQALKGHPHKVFTTGWQAGDQLARGVVAGVECMGPMKRWALLKDSSWLYSTIMRAGRSLRLQTSREFFAWVAQLQTLCSQGALESAVMMAGAPLRPAHAAVLRHPSEGRRSAKLTASFLCFWSS